MLREITTILQPWDELNSLLSRNFAFQSDMGSPIRMAGDLATAIKHLPETCAVVDRAALKDSEEFKMVGDVADGWKHGPQKLRDLQRRHSVSVRAIFEVSDDERFRFLRHEVLITYSESRQADFMELAARAIRFWLENEKKTIQWPGVISHADGEFENEAVLYWDGDKQAQMSSTTIQVVKRVGGELIPWDPTSMMFVIKKA